MILLLHGSDELGIRRRLQRLKDDADGGSGMLATNLLSLDGREVKAEDIVGPAMTPPFLAPKRLILVEGFLDRWEQRGDQRAARSVDPFNPLFKAIENGLPPTSDIVLLGGSATRSNPMISRLTKLPGVTDEVVDAPTRDALIRFIRDEASARGIRFRAGRASEAHFENEEWIQRQEGDPVALIAGLTNGSTLMISNELDKLALYTMGREVTVDDVYALSSGEREAVSYNFLDAILDGKLGDALSNLAKLTAKDRVSQLLISNLLTRYRQVATMVEMLEDGASPEDIGKFMGGPGRYPNLRDSAIRRAKRIGPDGIRPAFEAIVEADRTTKTGEVDEELALEIAVMKLVRISGGR